MNDVARTNETDAEFARRLQEAEIQNPRPGVLLTQLSRHGDRVPLISQDHHRINRQVAAGVPRPPPSEASTDDDENGMTGTTQDEARRRLNERVSVCAILTVNVPQIIAVMVVLSHHWDDDPVCDEEHQMRWNWWAFLSATRMALYSAVVVYMVMNRPYLENNPELFMQTTNFKNITDALGLVWFVVGNMWLFGDDDSDECKHPEKSPVYKLSAIMILINYIQICLPCIIAFAMIPVFCFCMPCLIRVLARLHGGRLLHQPRGATEQDIEALPETVITQEMLDNSGDKTCPICLSDLAVGENGRQLRCKHIFHKSCIDEWLVVNATCPTCRAPIHEGTAATGDGGDGGGGDDDDIENPVHSVATSEGGSSVEMVERDLTLHGETSPESAADSQV